MCVFKADGRWEVVGSLQQGYLGALSDSHPQLNSQMVSLCECASLHTERGIHRCSGKVPSSSVC